MDIPMTPEILLAIAGFIAALAFGVRQITAAANSWIKAQNDAKLMLAENERLKTEAHARDMDAENEVQREFTDIMKTLAHQNGQWQPMVDTFATIAADFATAQTLNAKALDKINDTSGKVADGLNEMAKENKALRISLEAWPSTVDSTLAELVKKVEAVETAIANGNSEHTIIENILKHDVMGGINKIIVLLTPQPPTPPGAEAEPPQRQKPTLVDAARNDATVDSDDALPKTGTDG